FALFISATAFSQNEGEITGKVIDASTKVGLPGAHMILLSNDVTVMETGTNDNGVFVFKPLKPGKYDVSVNYTGYSTYNFKDLIVEANGLNFQVFEMNEGTDLIELVIKPSLVNVQVPGEITTFDAGMIGNMAVSHPLEVAAQAPKVQVDEKTGGMFLGGSREDATLYVVDGVKVIGSLYVPMNAIYSISVLTGGIPANYGDVTGGIVEITTKSYAGIY
ncbi:MAG: carboxypeptidase regulatory-like domain-containing protein, partial [Chitinophagales bacterium]